MKDKRKVAEQELLQVTGGASGAENANEKCESYNQGKNVYMDCMKDPDCQYTYHHETKDKCQKKIEL